MGLLKLEVQILSQYYRQWRDISDRIANKGCDVSQDTNALRSKPKESCCGFRMKLKKRIFVCGSIVADNDPVFLYFMLVSFRISYNVVFQN